MVKIITNPTVLMAAGKPPKQIEEFVGRLTGAVASLSVARMRSPQGWSEPGQTPEFDETSVVLSGCLRIETKTETHEVRANQAACVPKGEWVRYSTPHEGGAEYIAICQPAFSPDLVRRDASFLE
jgi:mannose-6-phosphate isomerase-like protein (cupin superfamily)